MSSLLDRRHLGAFVLVASLAGCGGDRPIAEPEPARTASSPRASAAVGAPAAMALEVTSVKGDPAVETEAVRRLLADAETALLSCVDPDQSTGVLSVRFAIEKDGSAADLRELSTTTYGSEESRRCMERLLASMRFPAAAHAEVEVTFEIRPRFQP